MITGEEARLHLGAEEEFFPARKAHVAFVVECLEGIAQKLRDAGYPIREDTPIDDLERFFSEDCFGNRLEFLQHRDKG